MRAKQLKSSTAAPATIEVDDICAIDPLPVAAIVPEQPAVDDIVEIELTAEQIDALLGGGSPLTRG